VTLLADIKTALRIKTDALDSEVETLIGSALYDMWRVGVSPALLDEDALDDEPNLFVKQAVTAYCKAHFGYDNAEADRFDDAYRRIVCDLMNSSENIAAKEEADGEEAAEQAAGLGSVPPQGQIGG
jgi:hypothetical protein